MHVYTKGKFYANCSKKRIVPNSHNHRVLQPSRTTSMIFVYIIYIFYIRVVRRALNLLRASFSPIFLRHKCYTCFFFPIFQYFVNYVCHAPWNFIRHPWILWAWIRPPWILRPWIRPPWIRPPFCTQHHKC